MPSVASEFLFIFMEIFPKKKTLDVIFFFNNFFYFLSFLKVSHFLI